MSESTPIGTLANVDGMSAKYVPPTYGETSFNCPYPDCGTYTAHEWYWIEAASLSGGETVPTEPLGFAYQILHGIHFKEGTAPSRVPRGSFTPAARVRCVNEVHASECYTCKRQALWVFRELIWPAAGDGPPPHADMPATVRTLYQEASSIVAKSPRGASALLRLAMEELCRGLGKPGNTFNENIGLLVKRGLDPKIVKALDVVRVTGNEVVHAGQIDSADTRAIAETLFKLVNIICERMITQENLVDSLHESLPQGPKDGITKRDKPKE